MSTHQSLPQCENRKWNRQTSSHFVPGRRLSAQGLYHILICTAKSSEKRVDYVKTLDCKQSECPGWPDMDPWVHVAGWHEASQRTTFCTEVGGGGKKQNEEKRNGITFLILNKNTICPSLHLFSLVMSPLLGTRDGLNGDIVAFWEQHPDAVWVWKAELQHQWFCCQGEDYTSGNFLINVADWKLHETVMMINNITVQQQ